jgi:DNA processing protein
MFEAHEPAQSSPGFSLPRNASRLGVTPASDRGTNGTSSMAQHSLRFVGPNDALRSISPFIEMGAYEALWATHGATFKRIAESLRENLDGFISDLVDAKLAVETARTVLEYFRSKGVGRFGVRVHHDAEYPARLRDATYPVELLYFQGSWDFVDSPSVAIVGTRKPSREGVLRTQKLVKQLVADDWTVVSGLAAGIDSVAHRAALEAGGRTIAVLGTPLSDVYPKENANLQAEIAHRFLVISQVPVQRYRQQMWKQNRLFFPERNVTMSALTRATVIVEASNTSGTLIQARAALKQKRKLFILDSCFRNPELLWPSKFEKLGAIRVEHYEQIRDALQADPGR